MITIARPLALSFLTAILCFSTAFLSTTWADEPKWISYQPPEGNANGEQIVFLAAGWEYRAEEGMTMLAKILAQKHGFACTVLFAINKENGTIDPNTADNIPGIEQLDTADLLVVLGMDLELPDDQMKHFVQYVESGKPVIGFRCAVLAFKNLKQRSSPYANYDTDAKSGGFGGMVLGEKWRGHHGHHAVESTRGLINGRYRKHPILRGVGGDIWGPTDVYQVDRLPAAAVVLAYGQVLKGMKPDDPPNFHKPIMPMIWTWERPVNFGTGRVMTSTIGAAEDLQSEDLRRIIVNGAYWALGMEASIPEKSDVDYVDPFEPSTFGRDKFRKGLKPNDYALQSPPRAGEKGPTASKPSGK
jgi:type 1 glutamine amidotransferase